SQELGTRCSLPVALHRWTAAGAAKPASGPWRPARRVAPGPVRILRPDGDVALPLALPLVDRPARNVHTGGLHVGVLRRGRRRPVFGARAFCQAALAADTYILDERAGRTIARSDRRPRRAVRRRDGLKPVADRRARRSG